MKFRKKALTHASMIRDFFFPFAWLWIVTKKVPFDTPVLSKGTMYFHSPRFHPFCFFKPLHLTITESPGRIGAAQSWSSITFLRKPLHHQMGFLSVTFAVIYSSLLRFVFLLRLLFRLSIFLDYTTHLVVVKSCFGWNFIFPAFFVPPSAWRVSLLPSPAFPAARTRKKSRRYT